MSLFDKKSDAPKPQSTTEYLFETTVTESQNLVDDLKNIASARKIPVELLDFTILEVKSFFKTYKEEEFLELIEVHRRKFEDRDFLLNPELKIKQLYKIEVYLKSARGSEEESAFMPPITIGANKNLTKIVVSVKKSLDIKYTSRLEDQMLHEINKKKLKARLLIGLFDGLLKSEIAKIAAKVRMHGFLEDDHSFVACQGIDPIASLNDDLIFHYKQKGQRKETHGRVDHSRRGFILAVEKGETLIEYVKSKEGSAGRNCKGELLKVAPPKKSFTIDFSVTDAIEVKEDEERVRYVAGRNGYAVLEKEGNKYDIQDEMELTEVSFKATGSIETSIKSDVKINIKESDVFKDAVGSGLSIETTELEVVGNVGSGATIRAKKITIGGQTHQTSKSYAETAAISVHRGLLECVDAKIGRLEGGKVVAEKVHIEQMIGGEISANEVYIDTLMSNAVITASHLIEIQSVKGAGNKLIIDPSSMKNYLEDIERIKKELEMGEIEMRQLTKQLQEKRLHLQKTKEGVEAVKAKIIELKEEGKTPPVAMMLKLRDYQKLVTTYNEQFALAQDKKERIKGLHEALHTIQEGILRAKVINKGIWKEFNEIKFRLVATGQEIIHVTSEGEGYHLFTIKHIAENKYEIFKSTTLE